MILRHDALAKLESHWAVYAVQEIERGRGQVVANSKLVRGALHDQMTLDFVDDPTDDALLERLATAYEIAASEGLAALLNAGDDALQQQAQAGAFRAFELRRVLPIPATPQAMVYHVLHLAALAYIGDRWADLRRWLVDHAEAVGQPDVANTTWDHRILYRVYAAWLRLFRKDSWKDLNDIGEIIAGLRNDQKEHEGRLLEGSPDQQQSVALRLVALYHWARATELLAKFMLQGSGADGRVEPQLDMHFERAIQANSAGGDVLLDLLVRWLHVAARRMVSGSLWTATAPINSRVTKFVRAMTHARHPMIELLPPQRAALVEQGLLDPANRAVVIELPTSGGKTTLAQFRILQALNQFAEDGGWVAYVAPTRALVAQILRRLRRDFSAIGVNVEQVSGGIEVDAFEETLLSAKPDQTTKRQPFDVLVSTPEKLGLIIRNKKVSRPLALVVVDEAHNIEDEDRGVRIELLLATLKKDCPAANYLLLMPFVERPELLAKWLGQDSGRLISLGTTAWQPNERIVGLFKHRDEGRKEGKKKLWSLTFHTVLTTPKTIHLQGTHQVGASNPLNVTFGDSKHLSDMTAAIAKVFSGRGTSIAVGDSIPNVWKMAEAIATSLEPSPHQPKEVELVEKFLRTEVGDEFSLVSMLKKGVAVHHAGLPDEAKTLVEWLAEESHLRVLCATTTIAQGINFPVSSVFLSRAAHPSKSGPIALKPREFWNLAGRAGRVQQDSVGVVGIAADTPQKEKTLSSFLGQATGELASRLLQLLDQLLRTDPANHLRAVIHDAQWADFRAFIAHLMHEAADVNEVVNNTEQLLRNTYAFTSLRSNPDAASKKKADRLVELTRGYARELTGHPERVTLADSTGFDPEGVRMAISGLGRLDKRLSAAEWQPKSLFGSGNALAELVGVMMQLPALNKQLEEIGGSGFNRKRVAAIAKAWVNGESIKAIAQTYFRKGTPNLTSEISNACKGIYRALVNSGVWGLAALSKIPGSGIPWKELAEEERRTFNLLPAFLYHGVNNEDSVLMRMNQVPRSVAGSLGQVMRKASGSARVLSVGEAREFLRELRVEAWDSVRPKDSSMSGDDYRAVWQQLSGESGE